MKLQKFKEKNPRKRGIIVFSILGVLLLAIVVFSNTFAIYEDIKKFNIISGNVSNLGEAIFFYHLPDGTVTALSSRVDSSLALDETNSTCNYGVVPKWVNGAISLDKTNATNTANQKIKCEVYMIDAVALAYAECKAQYGSDAAVCNIIASADPDNSKCLKVDENEMILYPNSSSTIMSDSDTPIICTMEDDYGTSYYLRGNHQDNNVKFANMCWKLMRITGTGGYKLIYNGDLDANGKCTTTSGRHNGFTGQELSLSGNKLYGTSYTKEGSTYTLTDTSTLNWPNDSSNIIGKYTCNSTSSTCSTLYAVTGEYTSTQAYGVKLDQNVIYATIGGSAFNANYLSPSYVGYMFNDAYTINYKNLSGDSNNYYYGESFTYNNGSYTLNNTVQLSGANKKSLNTHHYTCFNASDNSCQEMYYIYRSSTTTPYYIKLIGNETVSDALDKMLRNDNINVKNSSIKGVIDYWYKENILGTTYESYLEDTVFCNDRTIDDLGGWSETGSLSEELYFNGGKSKYYLKCPSKRDAFTVSDITKGNGVLTYPIGLLTTAEHTLTGNYTVNKTGAFYWASAPHSLDFNYGTESIMDGPSGDWRGSSGVYGSGAIRPAVSLKPGTNFKAGTDGTAANPYEVE